MNTKHTFVLCLALPLLACGGKDLPSDGAAGSSTGALTREDVQSFDKADWPFDYCEEYGWYGDGEICDEFCPLPDPDCESSCLDLGGECLTDIGDPGFGAICEDRGMTQAAGRCNFVNETCCITSDPPPPSCEQLKGTCLSDPLDPTFGAICEDFGMTQAPGTCEAFNQTCCVASSSNSCEALGGACMTDPGDPGFGAICEDLGLITLSAECGPINETCCGPASENRTPVEGVCIRNSNDACSTDDDCISGGCGGELCYNPAVSEGVSTCECSTPQVTGCGCVAGRCTWYD